MYCHACRLAILPGHEERCWWCFAPLCGHCWEATGHGGHAEADALNARSAAGTRPPPAALAEHVRRERARRVPEEKTS